MTLNRAAMVRLRFHKLRTRPPRPGGRRPQRLITRTGHKGRNVIRFNGRLGGSALTPGRWRVIISATARGKSSRAKTAGFTALQG